jgi:putative ABC transport system substrate-binding protein
MPTALRPTAVVALLLLAASFVAHSQAPGRTYQVGLVANSVPLAELHRSDGAQAFLDALRDRGWVQGKNIRIHWRSAEDRYERRPALIGELLAVPVDVLVVSDYFAVKDAVKQSRTVPIIGVGLANEETLATSLSKPGGNVTGLSASSDAGMIAKNFSLLKQIAPTISQVAYLVPWYVSADMDDWPELIEPARSLGLRIFTQRFETIEGIEAAIDEAVRRGAEALYADAWQPLYLKGNQLKVQRAVERHRLPTLYVHHGSSDNGGLFTHSSDPTHRYRQVAYIVDRILKGAKPGDIPIERPSRYELVINLRAAKAIGLAVPALMLVQADRVIR